MGKTQETQKSKDEQDIDQAVGALVDILAAALAEKHYKQALERQQKEKSPSS